VKYSLTGTLVFQRKIYFQYENGLVVSISYHDDSFQCKHFFSDFVRSKEFIDQTLFKIQPIINQFSTAAERHSEVNWAEVYPNSNEYPPTNLLTTNFLNDILGIEEEENLDYFSQIVENDTFSLE
jgi:hypothetical protein